MHVPDDRILEVVKRYCGTRQASELNTQVRRAGRRSSNSRPGIQKSSNTSANDGKRSAREFLDQVITLCDATLTREDCSAAYLEIGDLIKTAGALDLAGELYSRALAAGEHSSRLSLRTGTMAEAFLRRGEVRSCLGQWQSSRADLLKSRSLFRSLKEAVAVGRVDNILATNYAEQGKISQARRLFQDACRTFQNAGHSEMTGTALMNLGILFNIRGNYDDALAHYRRALTTFEQLGDVRRLAQLHHNIGMTYLLKGRTGEALKAFDFSQFLASKEHLLPVMATALLGKATVQYRKNDLPVALKLVSQALTMFEQCGDRLGQADGYKLKGMIHRDMNAYPLAESYLQTSLRLNTELHNRLNVAETQFELGTLERRRHNTKAALSAYAKARHLFVEVGADHEAQKTEHEIRILTRRHHAA
jgi:tetratricopeptide (TPR) repeat protein